MPAGNTIIMTETTYSAAFTAGGLFYEETRSCLPLLKEEQAEELLIKEAEKNAYVKINAESARKRVLQELRKRHKQAPADFWEYFESAGEAEQRLLLLFLSMKTYRLVFQFHFDVTLPAWRGSSSELDDYYFHMKLDEIAAAHEEVDSWSESTRRKVITVYLRMLREAGLLSEAGLLQTPPGVPEAFWCYFVHQGEAWFLEAGLLGEHQRAGIIEACT